jgi:hypothetical protein
MPTFPIKDYIYAACILVLVIGFSLFIRHERSVGEAKVVAADQKAVAAQVERNTAVQTVANVATQLAQVNYEHTIVAPVVNAPVPVRLCNLALRSRALPEPAVAVPSGSPTTDIGSTNADSTAELQRFADSAVAIARDADARVIALQADNAALRQEMEKSNAK